MPTAPETKSPATETKSPPPAVSLYGRSFATEAALSGESRPAWLALANLFPKLPAHLPVFDELGWESEIIRLMDRHPGSTGWLILTDGSTIVLRVKGQDHYVGSVIPTAAVRLTMSEDGGGPVTATLAEFISDNDPGALDEVVEWLAVATLGEGFRTGGGAGTEVRWACQGVVVSRSEHKSAAWWAAARQESNRLGSWRAVLDQLEEGAVTMSPASADLFLGWVRSVAGWSETAPALGLAETMPTGLVADQGGK